MNPPTAFRAIFPGAKLFAIKDSRAKLYVMEHPHPAMEGMSP